MCVYMNVGPYACGGLIDIRNHPQYLFHLIHWIRTFKSSPEPLNMDGTARLPFLWLLDLQEGHHTHPGLMFILGIGTLGFHFLCKSPSSSQANFIQATVLLNACTKIPWLEPQTCPICEPGPSPQHLSAQSRSNNSTVIASVTIAVTVRGEDGQIQWIFPAPITMSWCFLNKPKSESSVHQDSEGEQGLLLSRHILTQTSHSLLSKIIAKKKKRIKKLILPLHLWPN